MKWYLGCCLLLGTPVLWGFGALSYARHDGSLILMNVKIQDLPSLLFLIFMGPLAILIVSLVLWVMFILPVQVVWWGGRWAYRKAFAGRRNPESPASNL
jgi:hypothetical protein